MNPFTIRETQLVNRLGLNRDSLRELRTDSLTRGVHWSEGSHGSIMYSEAGEQALTDLVEQNEKNTALKAPLAEPGPIPPPPSACESNAALGKPGEACQSEKNGHAKDNQPEILSVASRSRPELMGRHFPNQRIVRAKRQNGELVDVRVKDSINFREKMANGTPMTLKARLESSRWTLAQPLPRWPGKW